MSDTAISTEPVNADAIDPDFEVEAEADDPEEN
jgi:hypothetical protein